MSKPRRIKLTKEQIFLGHARKPGFEIDVADHLAYEMVCKGRAAYVQPAPVKVETKKDKE